MRTLCTVAPYFPAPTEGTCENEVQVGVVRSLDTIPEVLSANAATHVSADFGEEQRKDPDLKLLICYLVDGTQPDDEMIARKVIAQAPQFTVIDNTLYLLDARQKDVKVVLRVVIPEHLKNDILSEYHAGEMAGHFSGPRLYRTLERRWYWQGMYADAV